MKLNIKELKQIFPQNTCDLDDHFEVTGITQDTRQLKNGNVYVAICGENFDGHDFISQAFEKGACAALVSKKSLKGKNLFFVDETIQALGKLAHFYRKNFSQPVVAITGSNGKTTTKDMLAHVLKDVVATQGNLNNHIGVPLTLLRFEDHARYFIVEMGMNHFEEIRYLTKMAEPNIGLITSVGQAHTESLGGKEGVAKAKGELFEELSESATAIVNNDDPLIRSLPTKARKISFGLFHPADVMAKDIQSQGTKTIFQVHFEMQVTPIEIQMIGEHHVRNSIAVFAIAQLLGVPLNVIQERLKTYTLPENRGKATTLKNLILFNDTYNANPDSMRANLQSLAMQYPQHKKIAVLGGMLELGAETKQMHYDVGKAAQELGYEKLYAFGENSENYLKGFGETNAFYFQTHDDLAKALIQDLEQRQETTALIFKGSRGMKMEAVLEKVKEYFEKM